MEKFKAITILLVAHIVVHAEPTITSASSSSKTLDLSARDYHIETTLVQNGKPQAVIVMNSQRPAYADIARQVQACIRELTGVEIKVIDERQTSTNDALSRSNVIVLGNLTTSLFIETLYWEWYTLLDLWYPGTGGYVLRTLHDPYGTGKNVILLGGSDDQGVADAADAFIRILAKGEPLEVGRLMDIKLGTGHTMPPKDEWIDPRLRIFRQDLPLPLGYTETSRAGLIYYYNGDEQAVKFFKNHALTTDVMTATDHYNAHTHAIIWDLIEESPLFSDEDRHNITAKLLVHAQGNDGTAGIDNLTRFPVTQKLLDRHTSMQAICTLTASRYFGKYWPSSEWEQNLQVVKALFDPQMTTGKADSDLGGCGIYTYFECALIPSLLMRDMRFRDSGAMRHYAELCLMHCDNTGYMPDSGQNTYTSYPTYTFQKCAALLNDGRFLATMARREEAERIGTFSDTTMEFTAGQVWDTGIEPLPMEKMIGVYHLPLTSFEHRVRGQSVPIEKSFDKLTMRTGFGRDDQYLLLDGLHGGPPGKPWPDVNSIVHFGQNGCSFLVSGIGGQNPVNHNVVTVAKDGLGQATGRVASLEEKADLPCFGYSHSRIKDYAFSSWDRHIFWRKGKWFVALDQLTIRDKGHYTFECQWRTIGKPEIAGGNITSTVWEWSKPNAPRDVLWIKNAEKLPVRYSEQLSGLFGPPETKSWESYCQRKSINRFRQVASGQRQPGDRQIFTNLFYVGGDRTRVDYEIIKIADHVAILTGDEQAYIGLTTNGAFERRGLSIKGSAFCASTDSMAVVGGTYLQYGSTTIETSKTSNIELDLVARRVTIEADQLLAVTVNGTQCEYPADKHSITVPGNTDEDKTILLAQIHKDAAEAKKRNLLAEPQSALSEMTAKWNYRAGAQVTSLYSGDVDGDGTIEALLGLKDGRVVCLDGQGKRRWEYHCSRAVRALAQISDTNGSAVLIGCDDEHIYAVSSDGSHLLWEYKCHVPPDRIRFFPWWTTDGKAKVQAIITDDLDGDGKIEVISGTGGGCVEVISNNGIRKWITPIRWGIPDRFAVVPMPDGSKTLLVDNSYCSCGSTTWRLTADGKLISDNAFHTGRQSWDMTAIPGLMVVDLDNNAELEAIVGRKGAYNEIAVYNAVTGKRRWIHTLADAVSAIDSIDINSDNIKEVIVGSNSTWLCAFDITGRQLWAKPMPHEILAVTAGRDLIVVACGDAAVYSVNHQGQIQARYLLTDVPLNHFVRMGNNLVVADKKGHVAALPQAP
jgi:outer membrane protein assembly factor BamB